MIGKVFLSSTGYDPALGRQVRDPTLEPKEPVTYTSVSIEMARRMARDPRHYTLGEMMAVWRGVMGDFSPEARLAISDLARAIDQRVARSYRKDEGSW